MAGLAVPLPPSGTRSDRPRVLWVTRAAPDRRPAGSEVYTAGLVDGVARAGADITFVGLAPSDGMAAVQRLRSDAAVDWRLAAVPERRALPSLASVLPLVAARASPRPMRALLREVIARGRFETVILENYAAGWALGLIADAPWRPDRTVYVAHNDETQLAADIARDFGGDPLRRLALRRNAAKIRRLEDRLLAAADLLVTLTDRDRDSLASRDPALATLVLPPGYNGPRRPERRIDAAVPRRAIMLGSVRWIAKRMNVAAFLREGDARLAEAGITLDIIGDVPDDFRAEWEPRLRATRFRGFVDDLDHELATARLGLVVEATGGGFKLKTLDYVFNRVPVAALSGSAEGLPTEVAASFLVAPDMGSLADRVVASIDDLDDLNARQTAAYGAAVGTFDWSRNGERLLSALAAPPRQGLGRSRSGHAAGPGPHRNPAFAHAASGRA